MGALCRARTDRTLGCRRLRGTDRPLYSGGWGIFLQVNVLHRLYYKIPSHMGQIAQYGLNILVGLNTLQPPTLDYVVSSS